MPGSKEANQMLKDAQEKCTRHQFFVLKTTLDWVPTILGDGQTVGSLCQTYYCEPCYTMPLREGQWFLFDWANNRKIW
eukprot:5969533-Karenia_brevis.AAC.1